MRDLHYFLAALLVASIISLVSGNVSPEIAKLAGKIAEAPYGTRPNQGVTLKRRSTSYHVPNYDYKHNTTHINLSSHRRVLGVDVDRRVIHVEPMVTMETLVKVALKHGLVPKVVPPFKRITVGGAIMASARSSASYRRGQFHDTCVYLTVVLGNGTVVTCSKTVHPELFHSLAGSYGTLGTVVGAGIECEQASPYVELSYTLAPTLESGLDLIQHLCQYQGPGEEDDDLVTPEDWGGASPDFVEAIHFAGQPTVLAIAGAYSQEGPRKDLPLFRCQWSHNLFYSEHLDDVRQKLERQEGFAAYVEVMHTFDYLFRFDRGAFWLAQYHHPAPPPPHVMSGEGPQGFIPPKQPKHPKHASNSLSRLEALRLHWPFSGWYYLLANRSLLFRILFRWLHTSSAIFHLLRLASSDTLSQRIILADLLLPIELASRLINYARSMLPVSSPLYLLPVRGSDTRQPFSPTGHMYTLFLDVGVYCRVYDGRARDYTQRLESLTANLQGRKALCCPNFYDRSEFWAGFPLYDNAEYQYLRDKYAASHVFPALDTKVCQPAEGSANTNRPGFWARYIQSRYRKFTTLLL